MHGQGCQHTYVLLITGAGFHLWLPVNSIFSASKPLLLTDTSLPVPSNDLFFLTSSPQGYSFYKVVCPTGKLLSHQENLSLGGRERGSEDKPYWALDSFLVHFLSLFPILLYPLKSSQLLNTNHKAPVQSPLSFDVLYGIVNCIKTRKIRIFGTTEASALWGPSSVGEACTLETMVLTAVYLKSLAVHFENG